MIQRIGETVADAAIAVCAGVEDWEGDGGLSGATRVLAGPLFVQLYRLHEATWGELDFNATARREGRRVLSQSYGAALARHYGVSEVALEPVLDEIIGWPLDVLRKVTAVERALAH